MRSLSARSVSEFALDEVRGSRDPLRAAQFVLHALFDLSAERRLQPSAERLAARWSALKLQPDGGRTSRGPLSELLASGPRSREDVAIVNCFFALGVAHQLESLPRENRRGFAREVAARSEFLLLHTPYSPFEFLPAVAPMELWVQIWDAVVDGLIDEVNRSGQLPGPSALVRAETLRHLPPEVRRAYTRRILSDCHDPEASLRYAALLSTLDDGRQDAPEPPPALPASGAAVPALLPPPPRGMVKVPAAWPAPRAAEPLAAVRGEQASGPAGLALRALLLLSGLLLLRDLGALLLRVLGVRRTTTLLLAEGELVAEERVLLFGRPLWHRRRAYAAPAVACIERDVPYRRLYLLLGLSLLTLLVALALPVVSPDGDALRYGLLAGCGAVLAGIALDLTRFLASYLQRGHCTVTVAVHGGDTYRLAGVPAPAVARFAEAARMLRARGRPAGEGLGS